MILAQRNEERCNSMQTSVDVGFELKLLVEIAVGGGALPDNKIPHPVQISKCRKRPKTVPSSGKSCFVGAVVEKFCGMALCDLGSSWHQQTSHFKLKHNRPDAFSGPALLVPWYHGAMVSDGISYQFLHPLKKQVSSWVGSFIQKLRHFHIVLHLILMKNPKANKLLFILCAGSKW